MSKIMRITNVTRQTVIAENAALAMGFASRIIGLLNRTSLEPGGALIIKPCKSIHMFFMRFAIDAIFVDKDRRVVGCLKGLKPFRISPIFFKADYVIELPEGTIKDSRTEIGDEIEIYG